MVEKAVMKGTNFAKTAISDIKKTVVSADGQVDISKLAIKNRVNALDVGIFVWLFNRTFKIREGQKKPSSC